MKFRIVQLDTSKQGAEGTASVQEALDDFINKLESNGLGIFSEDFLPQQNSTRSLMMVVMDKNKGVPKTRYSYFTFDSRNGYAMVDKMIADKVFEIEKAGREIIRCKLVPMKNDAHVQLLLAHIPKGGSDETNSKDN